MMLTPNGEAPRCPRCNRLLSGAVAWGGSGDIWCDEGTGAGPEKSHRRGYAYSSYREMPAYVRIPVD